MHFNILHVKLENAYSRPQNRGFCGMLPKIGEQYKRHPKGTSLGGNTSGNTSYDAYTVYKAVIHYRSHFCHRRQRSCSLVSNIQRACSHQSSITFTRWRHSAPWIDHGVQIRPIIGVDLLQIYANYGAKPSISNFKDCLHKLKLWIITLCCGDIHGSVKHWWQQRKSYSIGYR